jgi:hypothetical protein
MFFNSGGIVEEPHLTNELPFNIEQLTRLIQSIPFLIKQAAENPRIILDHFQDLTECIVAYLQHFKNDKQRILARFDNLLQPLATEILDEMIKEADQLKTELEISLSSLDHTQTIDWNNQANACVRLFYRWNDPKELNKRILKLVSDKTEQLIDKDLKLIHEYQIQYLSKVDGQSSNLKNLESRLAKAIEEPLKNLVQLKTNVKQTESLQQASEWISKLDSEREGWFDQLLMKIDSSVKDLVLPDEEISSETLRELENEMHFVEHELAHIHQLLPKLDKNDEKEFYFTEVRLEGLKEHLEQFDSLTLPPLTRNRLEKLFNNITTTFNQISNREK